MRKRENAKKRSFKNGVRTQSFVENKRDTETNEAQNGKNEPQTNYVQTPTLVKIGRLLGPEPWKEIDPEKAGEVDLSTSVE